MITGPSGAGKGTLIKELVERVPELEVAVSATTRPRRPDEEDAREYHFFSEQEFVQRIGDDEFLEYVQYVGGRYGTLRSEIDRIAADGKVCVLELEIEGALRVQDEVAGAVTIFIAADVDELERRLVARRTESAGTIEKRIEIARWQLEQAYRFRYCVRNDDLERAAQALVALVETELNAQVPSSP